MRLLAIDSATERLALAAIDDGCATGRASARLSVQEAGGTATIRLSRETCRIEAVDLEGGAASSALALPALMDLLRRLDWNFADLDAIAFGRGPGGFTGLRTACAVAQGLAFGQDLPVVPLDSLALVAEDAARQWRAASSPAVPVGTTPAVWVAMDARMDEIYAGCYVDEGAAGWRAVVAPALTTPAALNEAWRAAPPVVVAGSALAAFGGRLETGDAHRVPCEAGRAAALGWLAATGFARGDVVPADQALPIYLRDKVAQTTQEREDAKAAKAVAAAQASS